MPQSAIQLTTLVNNAPAVLYMYILPPEGGRFLCVSDNSKSILGISSDDLVSDMNEFWSRVHQEDLDRLQEEDREANKQGNIFISDIRFVSPTKGEMWIRISSKPSNETEAGCTIWTGYMIDVTDLKTLEFELRDAVKYDSLTGLLNRSAIVDAIASEIKRHQRDKVDFSLLILDIDHFKKVNDNFGHSVGDAVLKFITSTVANELREVDRFGRYGGEEFLILMPNTNGNEAFVLGERIRGAVEHAGFDYEGTTIALTISIGVVSIAESDSLSFESMLNKADNALYKAKRSGRNKVFVYET